MSGRRGELSVLTTMLIEGLASVFLETDSSGDRVRPGAFADSLRRAGYVPMLWRHRPGSLAGVWTSLRETGRGLEVRGLVDGGKPYGRLALKGIGTGVNGLSIGFRPMRWRHRPDGGRDLLEVELVEVSLVENPMAKSARFRVVGAEQKALRPLGRRVWDEGAKRNENQPLLKKLHPHPTPLSLEGEGHSQRRC